MKRNWIWNGERRGWRLILVAMLSIWLMQCGSGGNPSTTRGETQAPLDADPRCVAFCRVGEPYGPTDNLHCTEASTNNCLASCDKMLEGVPAICAGCLLEKMRIYLPNENHIESAEFTCSVDYSRVWACSDLCPAP